MTSAFIIKVNIDTIDAATLSGIADDIRDSCETDGIAVLSVVPWAHPTTDAPASFLAPDTGAESTTF